MKSLYPSLIALLVLLGCQRPASKLLRGGTIVKEGLIDCFQPGIQAGGREVWCEASAVLSDGKNLIFANDKDMPDADAAVFYWVYSAGNMWSKKPAYLTQNLFKASQKYEDFAIAPDRKHAFLTTGFDRVKEGSNEWDSYNALLYWPITDNPQKILPKAVQLKAGEKFSMGLREALSQALLSPEFPRGMLYFKVEGVAATESKLYFGIREEGKKYDDFKYKVKVLTASYRFEGDSLVLRNDFQTLADIDIQSLQSNLPKSLALSCIEYDAERKLFWILTSIESETQGNSAYLWWASEEELKKDKLNLVTNSSTGQPLKFTHKAEDLTFIGSNRLFVIHDDDRNRTKVGNQTRQPHQAAYSIVEF